MAAKYLFRADDIKAGEATAQRFTKDKLTGVSNLNDMQALWYEIESGMAHLRLGNLGMVGLARILYGLCLEVAACDVFCQDAKGHESGLAGVHSIMPHLQHAAHRR